MCWNLIKRATTLNLTFKCHQHLPFISLSQTIVPNTTKASLKMAWITNTTKTSSCPRALSFPLFFPRQRTKTSQVCSHNIKYFIFPVAHTLDPEMVVAVSPQRPLWRHVNDAATNIPMAGSPVDNSRTISCLRSATITTHNYCVCFVRYVLKTLLRQSWKLSVARNVNVCTTDESASSCYL